MKRINETFFSPTLRLCLFFSIAITSPRPCVFGWKALLGSSVGGQKLPASHQ